MTEDLFQLDEINQLFLPHMKSKLMWFYQDMPEVELQPASDPNKPSTSRQPARSQPTGPVIIMKKKLFLTDGWECALTGICIYIFRINTSKQLPEEGFHKVQYQKVLDYRGQNAHEKMCASPSQRNTSIS